MNELAPIDVANVAAPARAHKAHRHHVHWRPRVGIPKSALFQRVEVNQLAAPESTRICLRLLDDVPIGKAPGDDIGLLTEILVGRWRWRAQCHTGHIEQAGAFRGQTRLIDERYEGRIIFPMIQPGHDHRCVRKIDHGARAKSRHQLPGTELRLCHGRVPQSSKSLM